MSGLLDNPVELTPEEFETEVANLLAKSGVGLKEFNVQKLEKIDGMGGVYEIDVTARFEALGADFLVLVECKHHKNPIKRDIVQVLYDRIRSVGAHKGMIFSTARFQSGAIEYAKAHGIALVQIAGGHTSYSVKSYVQPVELPPWVPKYVGWIIQLNDEGNELYQLIISGEPARLLNAFREN